MRLVLVILALLAVAAIVAAFCSAVFTAGIALGRLLKRLVLAVAIGLFGGLLVGTAASFTAKLDPAICGLLSGLALFLFEISRSRTTSFSTSKAPQFAPGAFERVSPEKWKPTQLEPRRDPSRRWLRWPWLRRASSGADALVMSWKELEELPGAASRLVVVRRSCDRLLDAASRDPLDADLVEWATFIRRRVPQLADAFFAEDRATGAIGRRALQEDLLDSLERVAAEADRRCLRRENSGSDFDLYREHILRRTGAADAD
jgi:hypothetical protein